MHIATNIDPYLENKPPTLVNLMCSQLKLIFNWDGCGCGYL